MPIDVTCECGKVHKVEAVPQAVFDQRLKSTADQRDGFKAEADKERAARQKLEADTATWKAAAEELTAVKTKAEEDSALSAAGLRADAAPWHRSYLRDRYDAAPKPETGDKPAFADWLKAQASAPDADPLLLALRATPGTPANPTPANPAPRQPIAPPTPGGNPVPPGASQVEAILQAARAASANGRPMNDADVRAQLRAADPQLAQQFPPKVDKPVLPK